VKEGGVAETRKRPRATGTDKTGSISNSANSLTVQALLDSGCLIGDCISQEIVNKLNAKHLIVHTNTTICSGFNNECNDNFPSLKINLSCINERFNLLENVQTLVFILPTTPIDLIIGRKTIKQHLFSKTVPSHFEVQKKLIESIDMTTESFGDNYSQEMYGATPLNQVESKGTPFKAHAHLTTETYTCTSNLKLDNDTVNFRVLTGKEKSVKQDDNSKEGHPLCLRNKYLSRDSCRDGGSCPCSLQKSPDDHMDVSGLDGLNDTPLLAPLLESDIPPLPLGGVTGRTRELTKKWLLQDDDDNDDDFDDTLDTENDVFHSFKNDFGDDPSTDTLDQIMIQGTPALRSQIRTILVCSLPVSPRNRPLFRPSNKK
jgi:hypothetical protein